MDQGRAFRGEADPSYESLLFQLAPKWGPVGRTLVQSHERRKMHLSAMSPDHDTLIKALGQTASRIEWLATLHGLDEDLSYLLTSSSEAIAGGVEAILSGPDPRTLDESRYLMEVESLLRLFAREPEELAKWKGTPPHLRNQKYGFGRLMDREGRMLELPDGSVLPERDEYASHSEAVHPAPLGARIAPAGDALTGMFSDLGDLLQHAMRVWERALDAAEATVDPLDQNPAPPLPSAPDLDRAPAVDALQ